LKLQKELLLVQKFLTDVRKLLLNVRLLLPNVQKLRTVCAGTAKPAPTAIFRVALCIIKAPKSRRARRLRAGWCC